MFVYESRNDTIARRVALQRANRFDSATSSIVLKTGKTAEIRSSVKGAIESRIIYLRMHTVKCTFPITYKGYMKSKLMAGR